MSPFTTTPEERFEAFVRERLAEREQFGRPDISEWLAEQWTARVPDDAPSGKRTPEVPNWHEFRRYCVPRALHGIEMLRGYAVAHTVPAHFAAGTSDDFYELADRVEGLVEMIDNRYLMQVYLGSRSIIIVPNASGLRPLTLRLPDLEGGRDFVVGPVCPEDVCDVLFATWKRGDQTVVYARRRLCETLDGEINRKRFAAAETFREAVAVDNDGRRITKADYVVVPVDGRWMRFSSFAMRGRVRRKVPQRFDVSADCLSALADLLQNVVRLPAGENNMIRFAFPSATQTWQMLVVGKDGVKVLFTRPLFCEQPLPDGGEDMGPVIEF